ncbi:MAG TPA: SpoIIE family protein phosphatase [Gemmataceae bacterium]|jgi:serine phosphatase RsbU (regulator of sigma subunit)/pSer/pThr/pTyr-binding forkhead associated (FHA) protein
MPVLHILKGADEGASIPLDSDKIILGRNPDCGVVIPVTSVSREHAQILRIQGRYFIVDGDGRGTPSRNGTYVNNQAIAARTPLKHNDKIRICDFQAVFMDPQSVTPPETDDESEEDGSSTIEATLTPSSHLLLEQQPAEKLRLLLEITANLSKTLNLDALMPKIVESLFQLFRQADRCFIIQAEEGNKRLMPRVVRTRRPHDEANARPSKTIVRKCLETAGAFLSDDASRDDRIQLSQSVVDFRIRSVMCVPLCAPDGKAFGVIQLDTQDHSKKFTEEDLKLLWGVANQAAIAMDNARLHEEVVARERLQRDLDLARSVQHSFLPRKLPKVAGYEFYAFYQSAQAVGGDYYGFIPLPQDRLAVTLGDVAGKGIAASLLMAKLSSDARFCLLAEANLGRAVGRLNDLLHEFASPLDRFVTLAAVVLDPSRHTVTLASAGHPSPQLWRKADAALQEAMPRSAAGLPLGMLEGSSYDACQIVLQPGDNLILFSDGVTDALDVRGKPFSIQGVQRVVREAGAVSAATLGERLIKAVQQYAVNREQQDDDITLVCLGRTT